MLIRWKGKHAEKWRKTELVAVLSMSGDLDVNCPGRITPLRRTNELKDLLSPHEAEGQVRVLQDLSIN